MNRKVSLYRCESYSVEEILPLVRKLYYDCMAPPIKGMRVLIKPNILSDQPPEKAVTTHPAVLEAVIRFVQEEGAATIAVGDAPAMHNKKFHPKKCGIYEVCQQTGAGWVYFGQEYSEMQIGKRNVFITDAYKECDLLLSLPKLKTHGFMVMTCGIKNTFGLIPNLHKAKQHAIHSNVNTFASFLVDMNEAITPHFILTDGIVGMEGDGPSNGFPKKIGALFASTNPLALDIVAAKLIGHDPAEIPTNAEAVKRGKWLNGYDEVEYVGDDIEPLCVPDFQRVKRSGIDRIMLQYIVKHVPFLRRLQRRPKFDHSRCIGCKACIKICPQGILSLDPKKQNWVLINDESCIRCFCCQEVCMENAIKIQGCF